MFNTGVLEDASFENLFLFTRIMRQSPCLHEALPNIAITSETRKACFISFVVFLVLGKFVCPIFWVVIWVVVIYNVEEGCENMLGETPELFRKTAEWVKREIISDLSICGNLVNKN